MNTPPTVLPSPRLPKATFLELVRALSQVQVSWQTAVQGLNGAAPASEKAWINASVTTIAPHGVDELRTRYNAARDANEYLLIGRRWLTLNLRAWSLDATLEASDLLTRVTFRLHTLGARAIFVPAKLSLRDVQPVHVYSDKTATAGGVARAIQAATVDIRWNWTIAADPLDASGGELRTVNGGGEPGQVIPMTLTP